MASEQGTHGLGMGNGLHWQGLSNLHFPNWLDYGIASSISPIKAEFRKWWAEARNQPHHAHHSCWVWFWIELTCRKDTVRRGAAISGSAAILGSTLVQGKPPNFHLLRDKNQNILQISSLTLSMQILPSILQRMLITSGKLRKILGDPQAQKNLIESRGRLISPERKNPSVS